MKKAVEKSLKFPNIRADQLLFIHIINNKY